MSKGQSINPSRVKSMGNGISELDGFRQLFNLNPHAAKDRLRGFWGDKHGDWDRANQQAETSIELLCAMSKKEIGFTVAYKVERSNKPNTEFVPITNLSKNGVE